MSISAHSRCYVFAQALPSAWHALSPSSLSHLLELLLMLQSPAVIFLGPPTQKKPLPHLRPQGAALFRGYLFFFFFNIFFSPGWLFIIC